MAMTQKNKTPAENFAGALKAHLLSAAPSDLSLTLGASSGDPLPALSKIFNLEEMSMEKLGDLSELQADAFMQDIQRRIILRKASEGIVATATLSLSPEQIAAIGDLRGEAVSISSSRTAEFVLASAYEKYAPEAQIFIDQKPGLIESIEPERSEQKIQVFSDGTMLSLLSAPNEANAKFRRSIIEQASALSELLAPNEIEAVRDAYAESLRQIDPSLAGPSGQPLPHGVLALIDQEALEMLSSITKPPTMMHVQDGDALLALYKDKIEAGSWKDGFSVAVNGHDCPSPREFQSSLESAGISTTTDFGASPLGSEAVVERLRASKAGAAPKRMTPGN